MSGPWLSIVGIGEDGLAGLGAAARALVDGAEVLVGGERHLAMLPGDDRERLAWPTPLKALVAEILARRGRPVCVLATGDPLWYGVAVTLARHVPRDETVVLPAASAFALACARLGWPLAEVDTLTLHGRPVSLVEPFVQPGARLSILSDGAATPADVAAALDARGFGPSRLVVLEHMGGPRERMLAGTAAEWALPGAAPPFAAFNTLAVECVAGPQARLLPRGPGLPDETFRHDGQLTKREVRAVTLAMLAPTPGARLWDVGAGCGSVAIEWMRADRRNAAVAVERDAGRRGLIAANAAALGVPKLAIVAGEAPAALAGLAAPDAVFVGGGLTGDGVVDTCWSALAPGGRLVANAVTIEGEARLLALHARLGGTLTRLAVARAEPVGCFHGWRPAMPVTQWVASKPWDAQS